MFSGLWLSQTFFNYFMLVKISKLQCSVKKVEKGGCSTLVVLKNYEMLQNVEEKDDPLHRLCYP